ncbi:unnamed protein product [Ectocarpus sp. 13 AM-2016]
MLMGTYFTSSVILMRVNLPPRHRVAITAVLGGMRFSFYQRWFDTVFLISGCVTAATLLAFHLANRNSDADHHEEDHNGNTRHQPPPTAIQATTRGRGQQAENAYGIGEGGGGFGVVADSRQGGGPSNSGGGGYYSKGGEQSAVRPRGRGAVDLSDWDYKTYFSSAGRGGGGGASGGERQAGGGRRSKQS